MGKFLRWHLSLVIHSPELFCCIFEAVQSAYPCSWRPRNQMSLSLFDTWLADHPEHPV